MKDSVTNAVSGYEPNYYWTTTANPNIIELVMTGTIPNDSKTIAIDPKDNQTIKIEQPAISLSEDFIDHILLSGNRTIVFWADGTKTIVKKADDAEDSLYAAVTAALAIKLFGSNSAVKRVIDRKTTVKKAKKTKQTDPSSSMRSVFNAVKNANMTANSFAELFRVFVETQNDNKTEQEVTESRNANKTGKEV